MTHHAGTMPVPCQPGLFHSRNRTVVFFRPGNGPEEEEEEEEMSKDYDWSDIVRAYCNGMDAGHDEAREYMARWLQDLEDKIAELHERSE